VFEIDKSSNISEKSTTECRCCWQIIDV